MKKFLKMLGSGCVLFFMACNQNKIPFSNASFQIILDESRELIHQPIQSMVFTSMNEVALIINHNKVIVANLTNGQQRTLLDTVVVDIDSIKQHYLIPQHPERIYTKSVQEDYSDIVRLHHLFYNAVNTTLYALVEVLIPYQGNYQNMKATFKEKEYFIAEWDVDFQQVKLAFIQKEKDFFGAFPHFSAPFYVDDSLLKMSAICTKNKPSDEFASILNFNKKAGVFTLVKTDTFLVKNVSHVKNYPELFIVQQRFLPSTNAVYILQQGNVVHSLDKNILHEIPDSGTVMHAALVNINLYTYQKEYALYAEFENAEYFLDSLPMYPQNSAVAMSSDYLAYVNRDMSHYYLQCLRLID